MMLKKIVLGIPLVFLLIASSHQADLAECACLPTAEIHL